ncbi:TIGR04540 family protein [Fictibacillus halophilus]|uniref:TIGR04540 family protein n=1 Tax=Fictibacillus halophilus TaxID=1610490 RepID=UPI001CFBFFD0|nr:TIGR04540 family protein [Fictibacillus halophilus]
MIFLQVKLFYKTQRDLAISLNSIIDAYWENSIDEKILMKKVSEVYINNQNKVLKNGGFTTVLKQQCGKRRLEIIENIIKSNDVNSN